MAENSDDTNESTNMFIRLHDILLKENGNFINQSCNSDILIFLGIDNEKYDCNARINPELYSIQPNEEDDEIAAPPPIETCERVVDDDISSNKYEIKVKNIDGLSKEQLRDKFESVGNFKDLTLINYEDLRYAVVEYSTEKSAIEAIKTFNGLENNDKKMHVYWNNEMKIRIEFEYEYKLIINNLSKAASKEKIKNILSIAGETKSIEIDRSSNKAEVEFYDKETLYNAVEYLNDDVYIDDIKIDVNEYITKKMKCNNHHQYQKYGDRQRYTVFVGCLSEDVNEDDLEKAFQVVGKVESVKIFRQRENSKSPDYAYVNFVDKESIDKAVKDLNGLGINGRFITVQYCKKKKNYNKDNSYSCKS